METKKSTRLFVLGLAILFFVALMPRVNYSNTRFMLWYERAQAFWAGLEDGRLERTYQQYHPGVTTMWVAGLGIQTYRIANGLAADEIPSTSSTNPNEPAPRAGQFAVDLVISGAIVLVAFLLSRITRWLIAFTAGFLLALDPFYITHSQFIHVDAFLATFMLVSAIAWIAFLQLGQRRYLFLSAVFGGLAALTKSPSYYLLPFIGLVALMQAAIDQGQLVSQPLDKRLIGSRAWRIAVQVGAWLAIAAATFFVLWPAMWLDPVGNLTSVFGAALLHAGRSHPSPLFFAGQVFKEDPGVLFYLAVLAWRTTAITSLAVLVTLYLLIKKRKSGEDMRLWWYMLLYAGGFVLLMTLSAKKQARYMLPAIVALDVLAAWAIVQVADMLAVRIRPPAIKGRPALIVAAILLIQAILVVRHQPQFGTHFNVLLGGSQVAKQVLPVGSQGEGMDVATDILNGIPGSDRLRVARYPASWLMFETKFDGQFAEAFDEPDYALFHINYRQRYPLNEQLQGIWDSCQRDDMAQTIAFDGITYVWICPAYSRNPDDHDMAYRRKVALGQHINMLGYDMIPAVLSPGDTLALKFYWQSDGRIKADNHIFIHLINRAGELVTQSDGVPVQGQRPSWSWLEDEIVEDVHTLLIPPELEPGQYTVTAGMYDYGTLARLAAVDPDGERHLEDRIELGQIQVVSP